MSNLPGETTSENSHGSLFARIEGDKSPVLLSLPSSHGFRLPSHTVNTNNKNRSSYSITRRRLVVRGWPGGRSWLLLLLPLFLLDALPLLGLPLAEPIELLLVLVVHRGISVWRSERGWTVSVAAF